MYVCMFTITQRKYKVIFHVTNSGIEKLSSIKIWVISDFLSDTNTPNSDLFSSLFSYPGDSLSH